MGRQDMTLLGKAARVVAAVCVAAHLSAAAGLAGTDARRGPVTNLPLPRFVSLKTDEGNVRRGPSLTHRIDWVFKRRGMPLQIVAEYGHWRRVQDRDGAGGWVHYALLSGARTVLVEQDMLTVHSRPDPMAPVTAAFELGVVARLGECNGDWCKITAGGYSGWAPSHDLWGVDPGEQRD
jgi:SH3-like domain-containing protein